MEKLMRALKLEINREKTRVCRVPEESFDFLGYTFTQSYKVNGGQPYIGTRPSKKKIAGINEKLSKLTERQTLGEATADKIGQLNALIRGWGNYSYRAVDSHARNRLRWWLRKKHKVKGSGTGKFPDEYLYETLGLYRLETTTRGYPWAKA